MAKRKQEEYQESLKWPNLFANVEAVQLLVSRPEWKLLVEDCQAWVERLSYKLAHNVPTTEEAERLQVWDRGLMAGLERIVDLEQDAKDWKDQHK